MKRAVRFFQRIGFILSFWGMKSPYSESVFKLKDCRLAAMVVFPPTGPTWDERFNKPVKIEPEEEPWCACDIPGDFRDDGAITRNPSTGTINGCNGHCRQCGGRDWRPWCSED